MLVLEAQDCGQSPHAQIPSDWFSLTTVIPKLSSIAVKKQTGSEVNYQPKILKLDVCAKVFGSW